MKKVQLQLIVIGVCVITIVSSIVGNLKKKAANQTAPPLKAPPAPAVSQQAPPMPVPPVLAGIKIIRAQNERTKLNWGKDPFAVSSDVDKEYQKIQLQLKGISFGKDKSGFAFINNEIVKKGDKIGDYEIAEVEKNRVLLKKGNQSFYLALPEEPIKGKGAK